MFINVGARNLLLRGERQKFLAEEWPRVQATIQRLGLKAEELLNDVAPPTTSASNESPSSAAFHDASPTSVSSNAAEEKEKP